MSSLNDMEYKYLLYSAHPTYGMPGFERFIESRVNLNTISPINHMNALHYIASLRDHKLALDASRALVAQGFVGINHQDSLLKTPLIYAIESGNCQLVKKMIYAWQADIEIPDNKGETSIFHILKKEDVCDCLFNVFLEQKANLSHANKAGQTPLQIIRNSPDHQTLLNEIENRHEIVDPCNPRIYMKDQVFHEMTKNGDDESQVYKDLKGLTDSSNIRQLKPLTHDSFNALDALKAKFPNFRELLGKIQERLTLQNLSANPCVRMRPILIHGGPGIGKTRFAKELAKALEIDFHRINCGNIDAKQAFSGYAPSYRNASPGRIINFLLNGESANPLIMLDEFEKLTSNGGDPFGPIYALLEPETAVSFMDDYYHVGFDFSQTIWVATANDINIIPDAIQSRFMLYEVPTPDEDDMRIITQSVYSDIVSGNKDHWGSRFSDTLYDEVINILIDSSPRKLYSILESAMGKAAMRYLDDPDDPDDHEIVLSPKDFGYDLDRNGGNFGFQ